MPVNLQAPDRLIPVKGVRLAATQTAIRYRNRDDLALIALAPDSRCAAVFTRNAFCAAPVVVARAHLAHAAPRWLLLNAGNANAGTGQAGQEDAYACCAALAAQVRDQPQAVLPFSTGVIGERLPVANIIGRLPALIEQLDEDRWLAAARAIMTTDTLPKGYSETVLTDQGPLTLTGIAKGAGMIRPDMATLLAFVATDAALEQASLESALQDAVEQSFHCITVDGDTSTNDACVLIATGQSGVAIDSLTHADGVRFRQALNGLMRRLAQAIVRDAEGATKFIRVAVEDAAHVAEARQAAFTIAHSPLVKTALFASDPNWGRILAAVGRAGIEAFDIASVAIFLDDVQVVAGGARALDYDEAQGRNVLAGPEFTIRIRLGRGSERAVVWTSDLSYDYVRINAEYRT